MAPIDDSRRPEDNPFINFRRFADSQVASVLNTLFSLSTTVADFNDAHIAREQCLFGRADRKWCAELAKVEFHAAKLRSGGSELYKAGDMEAQINKSEQLMELDSQAEAIRKHIICNVWTRGEQVAITEPCKQFDKWMRREETEATEDQSRSHLMERVANAKGQQWGGTWDWGFPAPFDSEEHTRGNHLDAHSVQAHGQSIIDEFGSAIAREVPRAFAKWVAQEDRKPANEEPSYEYSHDHEDQHDDPPTPKVHHSRWSKDMPATELDEYERMLGRTHAPGAITQKSEESKPLSILSTLTTTERTVAPDGSVTTKVVMKKRFANGQEESSETVHTQRGQDNNAELHDPWKATQEAQTYEQPSKGEKKTGWFWSS
jgi:hypothetical protein